MSENYLRLIPEDPSEMPSTEAAAATVAILQKIFPEAEQIRAHRYGEIKFIDPGSNLARVLCPDLTGAWPAWMDESSTSHFDARNVIVSCCSKSIDLNDLIYEWPAGFAKFVLEAVNPKLGGSLTGEALNELEAALGTRLRQIKAHL